MKKAYAVVFLLAGIWALAMPVAAQKVIPRAEFTEPVFTLNTPRNGQTLQGGSVVSVNWDLTVDKSISENPWSEMELFLADDNGLFTRITPQLSLSAKTFEWTVPRINSRTVWLVAQFGIEGEGDFSLLRQVGSFRIASKGGPVITLNSLAHSPRAGEDMTISWTSELIDQTRGFDVMISYDRGAHFFKAGTTAESRFSLPVEDDFAGAVTVKIVGVGTDGSKVSTMLTPEATFKVKGKDQ